MPTLATCPVCRASGGLPDAALGGLFGCPRCGAHFPEPQAVAAPALDAGPRDPGALVDYADGLSVWVGGDKRNSTPPPRAGLTGASAPAVGPPSGAAEGPPVEITVENAGAHVVWLRQEIERFNSFVAQQFEQLHRGREEAARAASQVRATAVMREQELNRARAALAAREAALDRREAELDRHRSEFERREAALARLEDDLRRRAREADEIEDALRAELEEREREVEADRRAVREEAARLRARSPAATPSPAGPQASGDRAGTAG